MLKVETNSAFEIGRVSRVELAKAIYMTAAVLVQRDQEPIKVSREVLKFTVSNLELVLKDTSLDICP